MKQEQINRMAAHLRAEQKARVGYPYPERTAERTWASENIPQSKRDFDAILFAVRSGGWFAMEKDVADLLGRPELATQWTAKKTSAARTCRRCGAPAVGVSNFGGWACANHYDELS